MTTITAGAVMPVSGAFDTTPAYSGTFIPTIWSSKLNIKFYAATVFGAISNTNWENEISSMGDKVIINNIPSISIKPYKIGSTLTYEVPVPEVVELVIDQAYSFSYAVQDVLNYQAKPNLLDMFATDAANQLKIQVDTECLYATFQDAAAANVGSSAGVVSDYNLGTSLAPLDLNPSNVLSTITAMATVLDEQNIPDTDRFLVITPYERQILMSSPLAQAQFMGDSTSILRNSTIGRIDRFTVHVSNLLPKAAAGYDFTYPTAVSESNALKRHIILAGHKSAMTFASQISKTESLRNPTDFGDVIRGLIVYGRKTVKGAGLTYAQIKG